MLFSQGAHLLAGLVPGLERGNGGNGSGFPLLIPFSRFPAPPPSAALLAHLSPDWACRNREDKSPGESASSHSSASPGSGTSLPPPSLQHQSSPTQQPKLFRPWLNDGAGSTPSSPASPTPSTLPPTSTIPSQLHSPLLDGTAEEGTVGAERKRSGRVSGSRNERVVPVEPTPLLKQQSTLEQIATNLGKCSVGHRCIYCGKIYSRKYGLKIHLRTHSGHKPLKCRICDRAFGDPSNLNKHTRLHAEHGRELMEESEKWESKVPLHDLKRDFERRLTSTTGYPSMAILPPPSHHPSFTSH